MAQVVKSKCKRDTSTPQSGSAAPPRRFRILDFLGGSSTSSDERDDSVESYRLDNSEESIDRMIAATQAALERLPTDENGRAIVEDKTCFTYQYPDDSRSTS
jgi:hypothetical protein